MKYITLVLGALLLYGITAAHAEEKSYPAPAWLTTPPLTPLPPVPAETSVPPETSVPAMVPVKRESRADCIREETKHLGSRRVAERICNPHNYVTDPNEWGWETTGGSCAFVRVKGSGAKRKHDVVCD